MSEVLSEYKKYIQQKYPNLIRENLDINSIIYHAIDHYAQYIEYVNLTALSSNITIEIQKNIKPINDSIQKLISPKTISTVKGQTSEQLVELWCQTAFPDSIITTTSKTPKSTDIMLEINKNLKIMIEVKCYSSSVPTREIDKFKSDMSKLNCKFGIFLSIGQRISKIPRFYIENINNKYLLYVPNANLINFTWSVLICRELNVFFNDQCQVDINFILSNLIHYINNIQVSINNITKNLNRMKKQIDNINNTISDIGTSTNNYITTIITKYKK
jgi:hypothetical protein